MKGPGYLARGFELLWQPGIRPFVIIPLLVNLLLFAGLTWYLIDRFETLVTWMMAYVPAWLDFIVWLLWLLFGLALLMIYGYSFAIFGNLIASPFYGLLAERVQARVRGTLDSQPLTPALVWQITRSSLQREIQKLLFFLPRILLLLLAALVLSLIPVVDLLVPALFFAWGSWSLALEFLDYPADNNRVSFAAMRVRLRRRQSTYLSFGAATLLLTTLPVINMIAIPAAVIGATLMWLEQFQDQDRPPTTGF